MLHTSISYSSKVFVTLQLSYKKRLCSCCACRLYILRIRINQIRLYHSTYLVDYTFPSLTILNILKKHIIIKYWGDSLVIQYFKFPTIVFSSTTCFFLHFCSIFIWKFRISKPEFRVHYLKFSTKYFKCKYKLTQIWSFSILSIFKSHKL